MRFRKIKTDLQFHRVAVLHRRVRSKRQNCNFTVRHESDRKTKLLLHCAPWMRVERQTFLFLISCNKKQLYVPLDGNHEHQWMVILVFVCGPKLTLAQLAFRKCWSEPRCGGAATKNMGISVGETSLT